MNTKSSEPGQLVKFSTQPSKASVGRSVLWSAIGAAGTHLVGFGSFLLIARALDPATFGLVAFATLFIALLTLFVQQGFTQAIVQRPAVATDHLATAFWTNLGLSIALSVTLVFVAEPLSHAFDEPSLSAVLRALSLSIVLGAFSGVQTAILQREMRFDVLATRTLIGSIVGGTVGVGLAWSGYGVWALVAQTLVGQSVIVVGLWGATGWRPRAVFSLERLRELWGFGLSIVGSSLVNFANTRAADFLIGIMLGKHALGLYSVSSKVQTALTDLLIHTITRVSLATLSRFQGDLESFRRTYYAGVRLTAAIAVPTFVGVAALAPDIAEVVFGQQWAHAGPIIAILALLGIVTAVGSFNVTAISSLGYPQYNLRLDALNAVVTLIAVMISSPWGLKAVAIAFVGRAYLLWPLRYLVLRRLSGVTFSQLGSATWGIMASASLMAASMLWLRTQDLGLEQSFRLVLLIGLGAVIYITALTAFTPGTVRQGIDLARAALAGSSKQYSLS